MRRGSARARLGLPARLVTFSGTNPCVVLDLSSTGARIAAEVRLRVGMMVVVEGIPVELFGTVRWVETGTFGVSFDTPLPHANVVAMRHHADLEPERERRALLEDVRRWVQGH